MCDELEKLMFNRIVADFKTWDKEKLQNHYHSSEVQNLSSDLKKEIEVILMINELGK